MKTCIKCRRELPDGSVFCCYCGKKQSAVKQRTHKRAHGTGTITTDKRYKKPYIAYAPADRYGQQRVFLGNYATRKEAQQALEAFVQDGRPKLHNATLHDVYEIWSASHYPEVSESAVRLYRSMWKRFKPLYPMRFDELRTAHWQEIVSAGTSKSACEILRTMASMLTKCAMENDIVRKSYADFVKIPRFDKTEKQIFDKEQRGKLWAHSDRHCVQVVLFMIYTGFRIGEVAMLRPEDVHLDEGYIIGGEKTEAGRERIVPFPESIPEIRAFVGEWLGASRGVLVGSRTEIRRQFDEALDICEIDGNFTPHCTRHTFASLSSAAGMRPENLQKIIGHANYQTTAGVYIHQDVSTLVAEMGKLQR